VTIENFNGGITLVPGDGPSLDITWTITYPDGSTPGGPEIVWDNTEGFHLWIEPLDGDSICGTVDFIVSTPPGSDYEYVLESVNGNIEVEECSGSAMISLVNGSISVREFDGLLWLELVNGEMTFADCPGIRVAEVVNGQVSGSISSLDGDLTISTVNGPVDLDLPSGAGLITLETMSGSIDIDGFGDPVVVTELVEKYSEFGEGDRSISIETVSGDILIRSTD